MFIHVPYLPYWTCNLGRLIYRYTTCSYTHVPWFRWIRAQLLRTFWRGHGFDLGHCHDRRPFQPVGMLGWHFNLNGSVSDGFFLNCFVHRSSKPIKTIRTPKDLLAPVPDVQICLDSASLGFSGRAEPPSPEAFRAGAQDCAVWDPRDPSWRWLPRKVMQNDMLSQHKWI